MPAFVNNRVVHLLHWELDNLAWQCLGQPPRRLNQDLAQDLGLSTAPSASAYLRLVAVAPPAEDLIGPAPAPAAAPGDSGAASGGGGGGGGSNGALAALAAKLQPHQRRRCAAQRPGLVRQHGGTAAEGQLVRGLDRVSSCWRAENLYVVCVVSACMSKSVTDSVRTGMSLHGAVPSGAGGSQERGLLCIIHVAHASTHKTLLAASALVTVQPGQPAAGLGV